MTKPLHLKESETAHMVVSCEGHLRKAELADLQKKLLDIDGPRSFSLRFVPYGKNNATPPCLNHKRIEVTVHQMVTGTLEDSTEGAVLTFTSTVVKDTGRYKKGHTLSFKLLVRTVQGERAPSVTLSWEE